MDEKIERFKKRQEIKNNSLNKQIELSTKNVDSTMVDNYQNSEIDTNLISETENNQIERFEFSLTETNENFDKVEELLASLSTTYNKQRLDLLLTESKKSILDNIIKPFGIGKFIVAKYDKEGGTVTTIHNANNKKTEFNKGKGIYAEKNDEYLRTEYTNTKNSNNETFIGNKGVGDNFVKSKLIQNNKKVVDEYTDKLEKSSDTSPDHIKSLSQFHKEGGFMLDEKVKANFATDTENLAITKRNINQSIKDSDKQVWLDKQKKENSEDLKYEVNEEKIKKAIKRGNEVAKKHLPNNAGKIKYYSEKIGKTGIKEGAKFGLQQCIGLVLKELTEGIFDEISDIYHHGFNGQNKINASFFAVLKERLLRIGNRILLKWKDVVKAFGEGFFSGFLSNIVTVVINMFVTTGKRVVRIIREGLYSLLKALKLLFFPPENLNFREAAHEATKLIVAGLAITGGIILEEYLEVLTNTIPFADTISMVLVGITTGLSTSLLVFLLDKLDLFGVNQDKQHDFIVQELDKMIDNSFDNAEMILKSLEIRTIQ